MAGMHKAVSERHGMTTIAALVAIVAMIFASVIAAPQRAYAEGYNISDLGWVDKDDTSFRNQFRRRQDVEAVHFRHAGQLR